jgi:hypothetical protein
MITRDSIRKQVTELCIDGVLNCVREKTTIGCKYPFSLISSKINLEAMRYYWALTEGIEIIANTIIRNPRRMISGVYYEQVERKGEITGSLNASSTVIAQARTLDPTIFVINEPNLTYQSEPNHLVAWTLREAFEILLSARRVWSNLSKLSWFNRKMLLLERALRNAILQEVLVSPLGKMKPDRSTLRVAAKSRVAIYQKTIEMYDTLKRIEDGDEEAITSCLSETLVADLEHWQRLELGTGLKAATAISRIIDEPVELRFPFVTGHPIAEVGPYKLFWQYAIPQRPIDKLEVNEKWVRQIADTVGITLSDSRADIVVSHGEIVECIFECKYSESDAPPTQAVVDAASQLVRYARDLNPDSILDAQRLLEKCVIVVADCNIYEPIHSPRGAGLTRLKRNIYFSDAKNIRNNSLKAWAEELIGFRSTSNRSRSV